jgi:hypothetical protein
MSTRPVSRSPWEISSTLRPHSPSASLFSGSAP